MKTVGRHRRNPIEWDRDLEWDGVVILIDGAVTECNCYCRMNAHCGRLSCDVIRGHENRCVPG